MTSSLFLNQIQKGDWVVHEDHGIGQYEGLHIVSVDHLTHECVLLTYEDDGRLFVPVHQLDRIWRYGPPQEGQKDRLGSTVWKTRKEKLKKNLLEMSEFLMGIAAKRALIQAPVFSVNGSSYEKFCQGFPHTETEGQQQAIGDIIEDLGAGKPMDRLVCGDVGFGKTEVALRAAFIAASGGYQVLFVVPTTLLCRQHFQTLQARFEGTGMKVAQLSRLVPSKEIPSVYQGLAEGKISLLVATHSVFSAQMSFCRLGLVIVDEEHHFGVKQKEFLKSLTETIHLLTLTATPLPRTLHLALTGVRELSLMATPPSQRRCVEIFVGEEGEIDLKAIILKERERQGQVFYVCPRISDLADQEEKLRSWIPDLRMAVAHGRLSTDQLDQIMKDFDERHLELLLSTSIVESGIDVRQANTLIVHRADLFGLAQLYQLKGRVGRSSRQGFAYFLLPSLQGGQALSEATEKRLTALQTFTELGSGFALATQDMEIRGAGNLMGQEQSGHFRDVGFELYQSLLQDAIAMLKARSSVHSSSRESSGGRAHQTLPSSQAVSDRSSATPFPIYPLQEGLPPQIHLGISFLIPPSYVPDDSLRFQYYRRLSRFTQKAEFDTLSEELTKTFGPLPQETHTLFEMTELKVLCRQAGIEKIEAGEKGAVVTFGPHASGLFLSKAFLAYIADPKTRVTLRGSHQLIFRRQWPQPQERLKNLKVICKNLFKLRRAVR